MSVSLQVPVLVDKLFLEEYGVVALNQRLMESEDMLHAFILVHLGQVTHSAPGQGWSADEHSQVVLDPVAESR